jgi:hypothetical protein
MSITVLPFTKSITFMSIRVLLFTKWVTLMSVTIQLSREGVTIDGVWIDDSVYWTVTDRNYKQLYNTLTDLHNL